MDSSSSWVEGSGTGHRLGTQRAHPDAYGLQRARALCRGIGGGLARTGYCRAAVDVPEMDQPDVKPAPKPTDTIKL